MQHSIPTINKEQYERLEKLASNKEPDFSIYRKQHGFGDLLSSFLKEYNMSESKKSNEKNSAIK